MATFDSQIDREKTTIRLMVEIYCRGKRHTPSAGICASCGDLIHYAQGRIDHCPYLDSAKPACGLCRSNCFVPEIFRRFSEVMRYAGPRMLVRHPVLTVKHIWDAMLGERAR